MLMIEDRYSHETRRPWAYRISLFEIGQINAFGSEEQRSLGRYRTDVTAN